MVRLSACVVVKNEEGNLPQWLNSMRKIAGEMIVVDTGSTDATVSLAKAAGARVYEFIWCDDFAAAKNFALSKAVGDWILFLDADEYFTDKTVWNVPFYLEKMHKNQKVDAFFCRMVNVDRDDNNRCINVIQSLRIFRNQKSLQFREAVHEFLVRVGGPLRVMQLEVEVEIYHTGYSHNVIKSKLERNLKLLQQGIAKSGEKPWHYAYLSDCYYGLAEYDKSLYYAKRSIAENVVALGQESTIYRRLIDSMLLSGKDKAEIIQAVQQTIEKFPQMPEFVWNKGELLFEQKDYINAEKYLLRALQLQQEQKGSKNEGTFSGRINLVYCRLGELSVLKNDVPQALEYYTKSLQIYSHNEISLQMLYCLLRQQDPADVLALLQTLYDSSKQDLEFLVKVLSMYKTDKIYLYYVQTLQEKYKIYVADVSAAGFTVANKYQMAAEYAMSEIRDAYKLLILSILQEYDEQHYQVAKIFLPEMYKDVLDTCLGKTVELSDEAMMFYNTVQHVVKNSKENEVEKSHSTEVYENITMNKSLISQGRIIELLRALKKNPLVVETEKKLVKAFSVLNIDMTIIYDWIDNGFGLEKVKVLIDLAVLLYKNNKEEEALRLMCKAYEKNTKNPDIIYAFAFLLYLYGDDKGAIKVVESAPEMTMELSNLLQEVDGLSGKL